MSYYLFSMKFYNYVGISPDIGTYDRLKAILFNDFNSANKYIDQYKEGTMGYVLLKSKKVKILSEKEIDEIILIKDIIF